MSRSAPKKGASGTPAAEQGRVANGTAPRHSHVRELTPRSRTEIEIDEESTETESKSGFFSQTAKIKMGDTFPALKTVARFLTLESYRSLPKPDKLPDLSDLKDEASPATAETTDLVENISPQEAEELLDWDEMEIEENPKTPYQLYQFDLRVEDYLRQTKMRLGKFLLIASKK